METRDRDIWFLLPVLRDFESFSRIRTEIHASLGKAGWASSNIHFLAVDDSGESDPQANLVRNLPDVTVLATPYNMGHQRAVVYGLRYLLKKTSPEDLIVTLDADGQDQPSDVPRLLEGFFSHPVNPYRLVLARRTKRSESLLFKVFYFMFKTLFGILTGTQVRSGNFVLMQACGLATAISHPYFDVCYSSTLLTLRREIVFVPCARGSRYSGQSKMGFVGLVIHGLRMMFPFADRIAVRSLIFLGSTVGISLGAAVWLSAYGVSTGFYLAVSAILLSVLLLFQALVLFAILTVWQGSGFSQTQSEGRALLSTSRKGEWNKNVPKAS